jgi:hypothetical protein
MDSLQKMTDAQLASLPRLVLEQYISKKLKAAGIADPGLLSREIADARENPQRVESGVG